MATAAYIFALTFAIVVVTTTGDNPLSSYEVLLSWKSLEYKWPAPQTRERLLMTKEYIPQNNVITGIKVRGSRIFLTVPRWRAGVPSTLNVVDINQTYGDIQGAPLLVPYPGWEMQQVGNCNAFQYVQSMEIDRWGRMWAVDVGRVNIFKNAETKCRAKVVLIDLDKNEVIHKYEFPEEVVSPQTNFLNDVVVDCGDVDQDKDKCFAYISDAKDAKLVVYNLKEDKSWYVRHRTMMADNDALKMDILGGNYSFNVNIDGIALSPLSAGHDRVFYCPLSSFSLYSVPTSLLRESVNGVTLRDSDVTTHVKHRSSQSDGLAMDANGLLFYGLLQNNSVVYVNTTAETATSDPYKKEVLLVQNDVDLQWPDTFAFDDQGFLYTVTNRMQRYSTDSCDWSEVNYRVCRIFIGSLSYQYRKEDKVQQQQQDRLYPQVDNSLDLNSETNPTNLDNNAPDAPVGVTMHGNDVYQHHQDKTGAYDNNGDQQQQQDGNNNLGSGNHYNGQHHSQQFGDQSGVAATSAADSSSAPTLNEHLPVVLFLTVLMYNPMLRP